MSFTRTAAIAGIVLVILLIVNAVLLGNPPMIDEDTEEIQKYLKGNGDMHKIGALVGFAVLPLFAVFLAGIVRPIRASDQEHDEGWAVVVLAGAIVLAAVATMGGVLQAALFFRDGAEIDASTERALWDAATVAFAVTGIAIATLVGGVTIPQLRHGLVAAWQGWLGVLVALIGIAALAAAVSTNVGVSFLAMAAFIGFLVWTLATSLVMYMDSE